MTCPNCHKLLLPFVYAERTRQLYDMERAGMLIMGMADSYSVGLPTYYCRYCDESHFFTESNAIKKSSKKSYAKKQKLLP